MLADLLALFAQLPQLLQAAMAVMGALGALLAAALVVAKMVPGDQPDLFIEGLAAKVAAMIEKFK